MMEQIYDTNEKLRDFDFEKLVLSKPTLISGANYFIRFKKDNTPLYIQPPTCRTRNGFVKNGRKYYTDLLFTNEDEYIIHWFEKLEEYCIQYIYNHRDTWFDGDMEKADIENYFTSPLKIYKSGKFYLIRTNVPTALEKPSIKIYDEDENIVDFTTITENTKLMNVIEVQGIKCSARSFQIELEMKQALLPRPEEFKLFDKCVIQTKSTIQPPHATVSTIELDTSVIPDNVTVTTNDIIAHDIVNDVVDDISSKIEQSDILLPESDNSANNLGKFTENDHIDIDTDTVNSNMDEPVKKVMDVNTDSTDIDNTFNNTVNTNTFEDSMEEVVFTLEELPIGDKLTLKEPNEVYYQMYRDARQKAKMAKELALSSYLEAKNIKNTYMLNDIDSDTSDLEIDDESINSENDYN
jgi:hypothetical protein